MLADTIQRELGITTVQYSYITSSFLVSYTIMYAVSGRLIDRIGTRRGFLYFVSGWSVANMLHALANTALQFSFFRFLLGATEPANFPAGVKAVSEWFPMRERALAVGIFNAGTAVGARSRDAVSWIALTGVGVRPSDQRARVLSVGRLGTFYRLRRSSALGTEKENDSGDEERGRRDQNTGLSAVLKSLTRGMHSRPVLIDPITYFCLGFRRICTGARFDRQTSAIRWIPCVALAIGNIAQRRVRVLIRAAGASIARARPRCVGLVFDAVCCCW